MKVLRKCLVGMVASFGMLCGTHAAVLDLINNEVVIANSSYGDAIFTGSFQSPTGTGLIDPMLSIQNSPTEHGYNTSGGTVFDTKKVPQFSHDVQLSDLAVFSLGTTDYYIFVIDINETNSQAGKGISWDILQFYTSPTPSQTGTNVSTLGVLRWDLDGGGDNTIIYDDLASGSGEGDIAFLIPTSAFLTGPTPALSTDYVYMYQGFGFTGGLFVTDGGFEETYIGTGVTPFIPEVSTALPIALVLSGMFFFGSRYTRNRTMQPARC